jgi:hypothetical protein
MIGTGLALSFYNISASIAHCSCCTYVKLFISDSGTQFRERTSTAFNRKPINTRRVHSYISSNLCRQLYHYELLRLLLPTLPILQSQLRVSTGLFATLYRLLNLPSCRCKTLLYKVLTSFQSGHRPSGSVKRIELLIHIHMENEIRLSQHLGQLSYISSPRVIKPCAIIVHFKVLLVPSYCKDSCFLQSVGCL